MGKLNKSGSGLQKALAYVSVFCFVFSCVIVPVSSFGQGVQGAQLPAVGKMVGPSEAYDPAVLRGITVHPESPFTFEFIIDKGQSGLSDEALKAETEKLVKYFLVALAMPAKDLWVNLSPYEQGQMIPDQFGSTEMGREFLAQDYLLKQLTASMIYPEKELGKEFWARVYKKAQEMYGTTKVPINTFNKVWIVPDRAMVYEKGNTAMVGETHLKVMLEEDYLAMTNNSSSEKFGTNKIAKNDVKQINKVSSAIVKELIVPEIEKEVNTGKNFAPLRQAYYSLILATWFKKSLKDSVLGQLYADQGKMNGVAVNNQAEKDKIYDQYMQAFQTGVFNYVKKDYDIEAKREIKRKYVSGGIAMGDLSTLLSSPVTMPTPTAPMIMALSGVAPISSPLNEIPVFSSLPINNLEIATVNLAMPVTSPTSLKSPYQSVLSDATAFAQINGSLPLPGNLGIQNPQIVPGNQISSIESELRNLGNQDRIQVSSPVLRSFASEGARAEIVLSIPDLGKNVTELPKPIIDSLSARAQEVNDFNNDIKKGRISDSGPVALTILVPDKSYDMVVKQLSAIPSFSRMKVAMKMVDGIPLGRDYQAPENELKLFKQVPRVQKLAPPKFAETQGARFTNPAEFRYAVDVSRNNQNQPVFLPVANVPVATGVGDILSDYLATREEVPPLMSSFSGNTKYLTVSRNLNRPLNLPEIAVAWGKLDIDLPTVRHTVGRIAGDQDTITLSLPTVDNFQNNFLVASLPESQRAQLMTTKDNRGFASALEFLSTASFNNLQQTRNTNIVPYGEGLAVTVVPTARIDGLLVQPETNSTIFSSPITPGLPSDMRNLIQQMPSLPESGVVQNNLNLARSVYSEELQKIASNSSPIAKKGGIDFDPANLMMKVERQGGGSISYQVNPKEIERIKASGFDGLVPEVLSIAPTSLGELDKLSAPKAAVPSK